ncbi:MAG: radical SAM protein [Candidatus Caldatribacteriota bacterium]
MDSHTLKSVLNKKNLKIINETLHKVSPQIRKKLILWAILYPRYLKSYFPLYQSYLNSRNIREEELKNGLQVPSTLIISITPYCNLNCIGCYAHMVGNLYPASNLPKKDRSPLFLDYDKWKKVLGEAKELGIFLYIIAGGEPFLFPGLIKLCTEFKEQTFVIFTNGTAITDSDYKLLKQSTNLAVIVSVEGSYEFTTQRRGKGVYEKAFQTIHYLDKLGIPTGISSTITRANYSYWINPQNIDNLISQNIRILFLIEYIPQLPENKFKTNGIEHPNSLPEDNLSDHSLLLSTEERKEFRRQIIKFRTTKPIFIIHSPGDEEIFGGCISAGRGFAHLTSRGDLTPCPVSNLSTHNLNSSSLREALASPLFKEIRKNEHLLETDGSPCALFAHSEEVSKLANSVGAYRTDLKI